MIHNLKESNGKTIKENNLEKTHIYKIGQLVETEEGARLFISKQTRDCDGTPLYSLSYCNDPWNWANNHCTFGGFGEDSLKDLN